MKRFFMTLLCCIFYLCSEADRYASERLYDNGLPDGKEVTDSLLIAIPALLIGFVICWFTMWSKPNENAEKISFLGCSGCLMMIVGGIFLLPLLAYVELAAHALFWVALVVFVIVALISGIYSMFNKK